MTIENIKLEIKLGARTVLTQDGWFGVWEVKSGGVMASPDKGDWFKPVFVPWDKIVDAV